MSITKYIGNNKFRFKPTKEFKSLQVQALKMYQQVSKTIGQKIRAEEIVWEKPKTKKSIPFRSGLCKGYINLPDGTTIKPAEMRDSESWFKHIFENCTNKTLCGKVIENVCDRYASYCQRNSKLPNYIQIQKLNFNFKEGVCYNINNNTLQFTDFNKNKITLKIKDKTSVLNNKQLWLDQNEHKIKTNKNELKTGGVFIDKHNLFVVTVKKSYENTFDPKGFVAADINMARGDWLTFSHEINGEKTYPMPEYIIEQNKLINDIQSEINKSLKDHKPNKRAENNATTSFRKKNRLNWKKEHKNFEKAIRKHFVENIFPSIIQFCKDNKMGYAHDNIATGSKTGTFGQEKIKKIVFEICEENKIPIIKVNPRFTSQKCVECDHRHKNNRDGDKFCCVKCGFTANVHEMAAVNISNKGTDDYMTKGYSHF
jgi:transposase